MTGGWANRLALDRPELVAFTGAGGKSTLMLALAGELAAAGERVLVTTTTKMGRSQFIDLPSVVSRVDIEEINETLSSSNLVALATGGDDHKVTGPDPGVVDEIFRSASLDYLLVEADGARGRLLKAPADHEPVIPAGATMVVVLMGVGAVGGVLGEAAHRPEQAAALTGLGLSDVLGPEHCLTVLTHPNGGLKGVPATARVVVALTKVDTPERMNSAQWLTQRLEADDRISHVVVG